MVVRWQLYMIDVNAFCDAILPQNVKQVLGERHDVETVVAACRAQVLVGKNKRQIMNAFKNGRLVITQ